MESCSVDISVAQSYFDRFAQAFATFQGHQLAELFVTPGVALRRDGSTIALTTQEDVVRYYQTALEQHRSEGCRSCRWSQLTVVAMGRLSLLATVTWNLLRDDETVLMRWRQSYGLTNIAADDPRCFASAVHVE